VQFAHRGERLQDHEIEGSLKKVEFGFGWSQNASCAMATSS
jgi:hypothetical protein